MSELHATSPQDGQTTPPPSGEETSFNTSPRGSTTNGAGTQKRELELRPTLIIGLGGTGHRVAVELKARLEEQLGAESVYQQLIKFLCIDTADETMSAVYPSDPSKEVGISKDTEFLSVSGVPLRNLIANRNSSENENDDLRRLLPERLASAQIDQGAQQVRRLGRVAFYYYRENIRSRLTQVLSELNDARTYASHNLSETVYGYRVSRRRNKSARVIIVCSICGGTGSGMFIDMAYAVRSVDEKSEVTGVFFLPEAFPDINTNGRDRIRANAYASLLDLEFLNREVDDNEELYNFAGVTSNEKPYEQCYLVAPMTNTKMAIAGGMRTLAPVVAESLYCLVGTDIGKEFDSSWDNARFITNQYFGGFRTFYSAFGSSKIVYPTLLMRQNFELRTVQAVIKGYILKGDTQDIPESVQAEVESWLANLPSILDETIIQDSLSALAQARDESTLRMFFADALGEIDRLEEKAEARKLKNRTELKQRLKEKLQKMINDCLLLDQLTGATQNNSANRTHVGFTEAVVWLKALREAIQRRLNAPLRLVSRDFDAIPSRGFLGRVNRSDVQNFLRAYVDERRERDLRERLADLDEDAEEFDRDIERSLSFWTTELEKTQRGIETLRRGVSRFFTSTTQLVVTEDELQQELERVENNAEDGRGALPAIIREWRSAINRTLGQQGGLYASARDTYSPRLTELLKGICTAYFNEKRGKDATIATHYSTLSEVEKERKRTNLETQSQPLLSFMAGHLVPIEIHVEAAGDKSLERTADDTRFCTIADPTNYIRLSTIHGIPVSLLVNFKTYHDAYEALRENPTNLFHMTEALERNPYHPAYLSPEGMVIGSHTLETMFIRAIAYRWLILENVCNVGAEFYGELSRQAEKLGVPLVRSTRDNGVAVKTVFEEWVTPDDYRIRFQRDSRNALEGALQTLRGQAKHTDEYGRVLANSNGLYRVFMEAFRVYWDAQASDTVKRQNHQELVKEMLNENKFNETGWRPSWHFGDNPDPALVKTLLRLLDQYIKREERFQDELPSSYTGGA